MLKLKGLKKGQINSVKNYLRVASSALLLFLSLFIAAFSATPTLAASANGFRISPPRYELTIAPGTSQTVSLFVENLADSQVTAQPIVNDFVAGNNETGQPQLILDPNKSAPEHSFKPLVKHMSNTLIAPLERKEIKVTLSVPKNEAPGGYYGAIRFAPISGAVPSNTNVALTASVGTLFLITVPGNLTEKLTLTTFSATKNGVAGTLFNSGPVTLLTRLHNQGNIHLQPFGKIVVKNTFGKVVYTTELNNTDPRGNILPDTIRRFQNPLNIKHMFGRYTATGNFAYGSNGDIISAKTTFYVIPYVFTIVVIVILLFLIFVLPRLVRWYNRRILERAQAAAQPPQPPRPANPSN